MTRSSSEARSLALRPYMTACLLAVACALGLNSCYARSVFTDPFHDGKVLDTAGDKPSEELIASLQKSLEAAESEQERRRLTQELHAEAVRGRFPSARQCKRCHENHYQEWAISGHAYAQLSPVFNAMQGTIMKLTSGTNGDFCIRCHTPVGMTLGEDVFMSNLDRHPVSREGVTCVVCHRVNKSYGKVSARIGMAEGSIYEPIYGPTGNSGLKTVLEDKNRFAVRTGSSNEKGAQGGQAIHADAEEFFVLQQPAFCGMCHDVNDPDGFRLEEAFSEYKTSPAAARGTSCQDCHMGNKPGLESGYPEGPAAIVNGIPTRKRRLTKHSFVGPDYSIVHPALFPHNPDAVKESETDDGLATAREWLTFDVDAGWGEPEFEARVAKNPDAYTFPERWQSALDRELGRKIIRHQQERLAAIHEERLELFKNGYKLSEITIDEASPSAVRFHVEVRNGTDGHGAPTGFVAERLVFLRVTVKDAEGRVLFQSGDLDPNGDVRDAHSVYVHNGELPRDEQLFSLQSKFITVNERGSQREQILAVNYSRDPLAYVRPSASSSILTGRPRGARIHKQNIRPGGSKTASYRFDPSEVGAFKGPLSVEVKLVAGMVPVNLISAIKDVGFDYGLSAREVADRVVEGHLEVHTATAELRLDGPAGPPAPRAN